MNLLPVLLALSPVIVIFFCCSSCAAPPADVTGMVGWVISVGIAWLTETCRPTFSRGPGL